ncbi:MAG: hypothetical protein MI976_31870 [Pseudomonadales bacterium]|nr:hypothetical protein [Pseudomonadales bacterium]
MLTQEPKQAQVKLTQQGQKPVINTLALPPCSYALYPMRLSASFDEDLDPEMDYHPDKVESFIERFPTLESKVKALRPGYLYIYVDGHLYQEYKVSLSTNGHALYQQIDLIFDQGKDTRRTLVGLKQPFVLIPVEAKKVELGYSAVQWPWLRINTLGGIAPASRFNGAVATDERFLALNDTRLAQCKNPTVFTRESNKDREKRLQNATYNLGADNLHWQQLDKPAMESKSFIHAVDSEFHDKIAKAENQFLETIVLGVGVCVLNDHLDILDRLVQRHNLALNLMSKLLKDMQDPNLSGDKKALFPNSQHFTSAALIHKHLVAVGSASDDKYFAEQAKKYRDLIHVDDLNATLGMEYRERVNVLIGITHQQLEVFILNQFDQSLYPQLITTSESLWQQELLDMFACKFENEWETIPSNPIDMPVAELAFEFLGNLFSALCALPGGLDKSITGTSQDFEQYKQDILTNKALKWIEDTIDLNNELWQAIAIGRLNSMADKSASAAWEEDDTHVGAQTWFQTSRRAIQALNKMYTIFALKGSIELASLGSKHTLAVVKPIQRYLGMEFKSAELGQLVDTNPMNAKQFSRTVEKHARNNPVLLSNFFRENRPVILNKLGGEKVEQIKQRRQQEKEQFEQNLENEKDATYSQWQQEENAAHEKAENTYADVQADLAKQESAKKQKIADIQADIKQSNLNYNDRIFELEQEQQQLQSAWDHQNADLKAVEQQVVTSRNQSNQARAEHQQAQRDIKANRQQLIDINLKIKERAISASKEAEIKYAYYEPIYGEQSAKEMVSKYLAKEQVAIDQLKVEAKALEAKGAELEAKAARTQQRLNQTTAALEQNEAKLAKANTALKETQRQLDSNDSAENSLKTEHEQNQNTKKLALNDAELDLEEFQEVKQQRKNQAYGEMKEQKQAATATKNKKISDYDEQQSQQRKDFDTETQNAVATRKADEATHKSNNAEQAELADKQGKHVIDLNSEAGQAEWQSYQLARSDSSIRHLRLEQDGSYLNKLREKEKILQKLRPSEAGKGLSSFDPKELKGLSDKDLEKIRTMVLRKGAYDSYMKYLERHVMITSTIEDMEGVYKVYLGESAKEIDAKNLNVANSINGLLAIVEFFNLQEAYHVLQTDRTDYDRLNFLGCVLDTAASLEAITLSLTNHATNTARVAGGSTLWTSFSKAPLSATAAIATFMWFSYETWRMLSQNNGDDAWRAYAILTTGSAFGVAATFASGFFAVATGGVAVVLMLVGAFVLSYVWRENSDIVEYALARGPFGAGKGVLERMGFENVDIRAKPDVLEIHLEGKDIVRVNKATYQITDIEKYGYTSQKEGYRLEDTKFVSHADGSYSYQSENGALYIGRVGESLAGKSFNDPIEVEQYFSRHFQEEDEERYADDIYNDKKLSYQLDASTWEKSGKDYLEAVISALFPLSLEMEIVPKRTEHHGRTVRHFGNLLRVKYNVPFLAEVAGEPTIELDIYKPSILNRVGLGSPAKTILFQYKLLDAINQNKPYAARFSENGISVLELDLDNKQFLAEQGLNKNILASESYEFIVNLSCQHKLNSETLYYQPPLLSGEDAARRSNYAVRQEIKVFMRTR